MKKIVYFLLFALCLPIGLMAQSVDDDLYFIPSKDKQEKKETPVKKETKKQVTNIYTSPGTTVVVQDRKGRTRDVDEYNRRYDARDNEFVMDNDTLYIKEKSNPDLDGEWVTGEFNGTEDDYEYAERIIRFRNPRFAISISSPLYWDVVYGPNSWDWNVYTDGMYAYAFPTFSNPLWWDSRYGSYGWGWNRPYYAWGYSPGYWGGWYGGYWGGWYGGGYWGHHHHWHGGPSWGWGGGGSGHWTGPTYTNRRSSGQSSYRNPSTVRRYGSSAVRSSGSSVRGGSAVRSEGSSVRSSGSTYSRGTTSRRVVGTRTSGERSGSSSRSSATYSRPSSTRSSGSSSSSRSTGSSGYSRSSGTTTRSSSARSTYSRGSSEAPRSYSPASNSNTRSSSYGTSRSSSRSYSPASSGGSSSRGSYSSGGSSRSSSGGGSSRSGSARR